MNIVVIVIVSFFCSLFREVAGQLAYGKKDMRKLYKLPVVIFISTIGGLVLYFFTGPLFWAILALIYSVLSIPNKSNQYRNWYWFWGIVKATVMLFFTNALRADILGGGIDNLIGWRFIIAICLAIFAYAIITLKMADVMFRKGGK